MKAANIERNLREVDGALNSTNTLLDIYAAVKSFTESKEAFRREYKEYYDLLLSNYQVNMQSLQKKLASDSSMAIAFYKSDRGLYRLTVTGEILRADRMNYSNEMDSLATEIGILAQTNQKNTRLPQISHRLYQLLLADLDTLLPNALHIVANDNLETLPFNLLRKDSLTNNPRYLGVEHAISRQFSLRTMEMLNALRPAPKYHQPLALAPDFKESTDPTISALSYNEKEVTWLEEISGGAFYTSARATLDRYHEYAPNYGIIHLATHAKSNQQDGLESRIYFVDADNQPVALNARDIAQEKLEAELIVLSACETSRGGQNTVEGTIGLTRAYFAAGARTVVASNWAVNDFATAEMMQSFYNYTAEGQPAHIALQNARRDYREAHPDAHPSRWAAFEAFGGMQPVNWDRTKVWYGQISTTIWGGLLAAVCAVIGLFFYNRNRNYA
ncbi:CHAT domain-containing protein [Neolewinella antarctica]|uniref:CHAT domain-containing protein n=1 Tax=Neolewinella antarctica TaxID=442734 RepID=A0ABX0XGU2_9BACT|nr:CHAT domain-containing protein [Neolewinella antarctica]NJC28417.1 CHAT domain-containing protein [Neolewinella antarctica]